jgi:hypothetical protein
VTAEPDLEASLGHAAADHLIRVDAMHRPVCQPPGSAGRRAEEGGLAVFADAGRVEIFIDELLELVMRRHLVALAAFLVQPHPPALAAGVVVLDPHGNYGADAREGVGHDADQRAIAQADEGRRVEACERAARLFLGEHRRLAPAHDQRSDSLLAELEGISRGQSPLGPEHS